MMKFFNKKSSFSKKRNSSLAIGSSLPPIDQYQLGHSDTDGSLNEEDYETKLNTLRNSTISSEARSILRKNSRSHLRDDNLIPSISSSNVSNAAAAAALNKSNTIRRAQTKSYQSASDGSSYNRNPYNSLQHVPRKLPQSLMNTGRTSSFTNFNERSTRDSNVRRTSLLTNPRMPSQDQQYISPKRLAARSNSLNYSPNSKRTSSINSNTPGSNHKMIPSSGKTMSITSMLTNNSLDMSDMTIQSTTQKKGNTVIRQTKIIDSFGVTRRIITKTIKKIGAYEVVNSNVVNLSANEDASQDFGLDNATLNELAELDEMEEDYESLMLNKDTGNGVPNDFSHHFDGFDQPMVLLQSPQRPTTLDNNSISNKNGQNHPYDSLSEISLDNQDQNINVLPVRSKQKNNSTNCEIIEDTIMEEDEDEQDGENPTISEYKKEMQVINPETSLSNNADMLTPSNLSEETNISSSSHNKESSQSSNIFEPDDEDVKKVDELLEKAHPLADFDNDVPRTGAPVDLTSFEKPVMPLPTAAKSASSLESGDAVFFDAPSLETIDTKDDNMTGDTVNIKQQYLTSPTDINRSKHAPMRSSMRNYHSNHVNSSNRLISNQKSSSNLSLSKSDVTSVRSGRSKVSFRGGVEIIDKESTRPAPKLTQEEMYQSALRVAHERVYGTKYPEKANRSLDESTTKIGDKKQVSTNKLENKVNGTVDITGGDALMETIQPSGKRDKLKPRKMKWLNRLFNR